VPLLKEETEQEKHTQLRRSGRLGDVLLVEGTMLISQVFVALAFAALVAAPAIAEVREVRLGVKGAT